MKRFRLRSWVWGVITILAVLLSCYVDEVAFRERGYKAVGGEVIFYLMVLYSFIKFNIALFREFMAKRVKKDIRKRVRKVKMDKARVTPVIQSGSMFQK